MSIDDMSLDQCLDELAIYGSTSLLSQASCWFCSVQSRQESFGRIIDCGCYKLTKLEAAHECLKRAREANRGDG